METEFNDSWKLWYHHQKDNWTVNGYRQIYEINNIKEYWKLYNNWDVLGGINNKHFFLMRNDITPIWEDPSNKGGGCWSFKIDFSKSQDLWNDLSLYLVTEKLSNVTNDIVGISVCLKKNNFSVVKIWNRSSKNNNINLICKDILDKWGLDIIYIAHMPDINV